jgi:hypothetical protein
MLYFLTLACLVLISWLTHEIVNATLAVFEPSDWQDEYAEWADAIETPVTDDTINEMATYYGE